MNIVPRLWQLSGNEEELRVVPAPPGHLVIECEVISPPSSARRTVYVHFTPENVTRLVREARSAAIQARNTPMDRTVPVDPAQR